MSNEALRWRSYRNNTITKRYIIHYLIYLEHHANKTKTDFDALEDELLNILLAMDEACRAKRWQRVQRFGRILCAIDGFLHVRGYGSELVNRLDQVINAAKAEKNPLAEKEFSRILETLNAQSVSVKVDDLRQTIKARHVELREDESMGQTTVIMQRMMHGDAINGYSFENDDSLINLAEEFRSDQGISVEQLFQRVKPEDFPDWFRDFQRDKGHSLINTAMLATQAGNYSRAKELLQESAQALELTDSQMDKSIALINLGSALYLLGEYDQAERHFREGMDLASGLKDQLFIARLMLKRAAMVFLQGNCSQAEQLTRDSLTVFEHLGYKEENASALQALAEIVEEDGRYLEAQHLLQESLTIEKDLENKVGTTRCLCKLGDLALVRENYSEAEQFYRSGIEISKELDDSTQTALFLCQIGFLAHRQKDYNEAAKSYAFSLEVLEDRDSPVLCLCLRRLGQLALDLVHNQATFLGITR